MMDGKLRRRRFLQSASALGLGTGLADWAGLRGITPARAADMKVGPDGNLWFTETTNGTDNFFGYLTTAGKIKYFPVLASLGSLTGITAGADGNIYFRAGDNLIGATTAGTIHET